MGSRGGNAGGKAVRKKSFLRHFICFSSLEQMEFSVSWSDLYDEVSGGCKSVNIKVFLLKVNADGGLGYSTVITRTSRESGL